MAEKEKIASSQEVQYWNAKQEHKQKLIANLDASVAKLELNELHTHLLGMGSPEFWVDQVMCGVIPRLCTIEPWKDSSIPPEEFDEAIKRIIDRDIPSEGKEFSRFAKTKKNFIQLAAADTKKSEEEIRKHFTDDVVFRVEVLYQAFGLESVLEELRLYTLESRLFNAAQPKAFSQFFREYVYLNIRKDRFEWSYGLPNTFFVKMMSRFASSSDGLTAATDDSHTIKAAVYNLFAMLNRDGSLPCDTDLRAFRGNFTPEFYPMRFVMKDPIYHQHPHILGLLMNNVLDRYARAGVNYVEFSVGSGDLLSPVIWSHLRNSVYGYTKTFGPSHELNMNTDSDVGSTSTPRKKSKRKGRSSTEPPSKTMKTTHQSDEVNASSWDTLEASDIKGKLPKPLKNQLKPEWRTNAGMYNEAPTNRVMVRFLMAFPRNKVTGYDEFDKLLTEKMDSNFIKGNRHLTKSELSLLHMLHAKGTVDDVVNRLMMNIDDFLKNMHPDFFDNLNKLKSVLEGKTSQDKFLRCLVKNFVVGFDLVGDELGFPFCPFVHSECLEVIKLFRQEPYSSQKFGIRLHAGEGVPRSPSAEVSAANLNRVFDIHMGIILRSLQVLHDQDLPIRIGHGIGFLRYEEGKKWLRDNGIVCELNITSNHVLLADTNVKESLMNVATLNQFIAAKIPVILGTDDDGIWPIHKCEYHYRHISVAHEYCRAIMSGQIDEKGMAKMISDSKDARFAVNE